MGLEAIIFDMDGTLADTERDGHRPAYNAAFAEFGLPWHWDAATYGRLTDVTGGKERLAHFVAQHDPDFAPAEGLVRFIERLHACKTRFYVRRVREQGIPLRPGVRRLIDEARAKGLKLGIATTTTMDNVQALLQASLAPDAPGWFNCIGAGDCVARKKPARDIYEYVLRRLGVSAGVALAIEDSENGLRAARAARLKVVVTVTDYTREQDFGGAALVVDQLGEADRPSAVLHSTLDGAELQYVNLDVLRRVIAQG